MRKSRRLTEEHDDSTALHHAATRYNALEAAAHCRQSQWKREEQDLIQSHTAPNTVQHLQHAAMHCNTPQHTAALCNKLQHTAPDKSSGGGSSTNGGIDRGVLPHTDTRTHTHSPLHSRHTAPDNPTQHAATHCNTLQHTATHCNTLQQRHTVPDNPAPCKERQTGPGNPSGGGGPNGGGNDVAAQFSTLQHTAAHYGTLQRTWGSSTGGGSDVGAFPPPFGGDVDHSSGRKRLAAHADDETGR